METEQGEPFSKVCGGLSAVAPEFVPASKQQETTVTTPRAAADSTDCSSIEHSSPGRDSLYSSDAASLPPGFWLQSAEDDLATAAWFGSPESYLACSTDDPYNQEWVPEMCTVDEWGMISQLDLDNVDSSQVCASVVQSFVDDSWQVEPVEPAWEDVKAQSGPLPKNFKRALCRHFEQGKCFQGKNCTFAHGKAELRRDLQAEYKDPSEHLLTLVGAWGALTTRKPGTEPLTRSFLLGFQGLTPKDEAPWTGQWKNTSLTCVRLKSGKGKAHK